MSCIGRVSPILTQHKSSSRHVCSVQQTTAQRNAFERMCFVSEQQLTTMVMSLALGLAEHTVSTELKPHLGTRAPSLPPPPSLVWWLYVAHSAIAMSHRRRRMVVPGAGAPP